MSGEQLIFSRSLRILDNNPVRKEPEGPINLLFPSQWRLLYADVNSYPGTL